MSGSRVRENRMHGLTGGRWRSDSHGEPEPCTRWETNGTEPDHLPLADQPAAYLTRFWVVHLWVEDFRSCWSRPLPVQLRYGRLRLWEQPVKLGPAARFRAVRHVELAVDVREVELHGLLRHPEHPCELCIGMAFGDEPEDFELAPRQRCVRGRGRCYRLAARIQRGTNVREVNRMLERLTD